MSVAGIIGTAATWRYELAVILPERDEDADILVIISFWAAVITGLLALLSIIFWHSNIAVLLGNKSIEPWLYFVPISIVLTGIYNALNYWLNRHELYSRMSFSRIIRSSVGSGTNVGMGCLKTGVGGLIAGNLAGQFAATSILAKYFLKSGAYKTNVIDLKKIIPLAKRYLNHPVHLMPSHFIGSVAVQLPILIISGFFGATVTGFYSLAQRMISMPSSLIANAIGDVYRQKASAAYIKHGEFRGLFLQTLSKTFFLALPPFAVLFFIAPDLFSFVFGETWRVAGEYSRIMVVGAFFQFVYVPVDKGALIVGATRYILIWHIFRLLGFATIAFILTMVKVNVTKVIWGVVVVNSTLYLADIIIGYQFSKGR
jgi:O-antigen/teichoic acid export membrane protein